MAGEIFISYRRADESWARLLHAQLRAEGVEAWYDAHVAPGEDWRIATAKALEASRIFVLLFSSNAAESSDIAKELAAATLEKKLIIPVRLENIAPKGAFLYELASRNWVNAYDNTEAKLAELAKGLAHLVKTGARDESVLPFDRSGAGQSPAAKKWFRMPALIAATAIAIVALIIWSIGLRRDEAPTVPKNVVAVLPFDNIGDASAFYLSEGLSDELRNGLMHVHNLRVLAPATSRTFRAAPLETTKIAALLKVGQLIEGSFRKEDGQLRVSVQVVDGVTGFQTWSQSFERPANDLVQLQQELAVAVAAALTGRSDAYRELASPPSSNLSAYDALLLARNYEQEVRNAQVVDKVKLNKAIEFYRVAVKADPKSAPAHSRLAGALLYSGKADDAEVEIKRAVVLNPNLSEVQYTLGNYYYARNLPGVGRAYERAVALNPNNVDALSELARVRWSSSLEPLKTTEELYRHALELDPLSLPRYAQLGYFLGTTGQRNKALALTEEIASRLRNPQGLQAIGEILVPTGDVDLAIASVKQALRLDPKNEDIKAQLAELYAEIGDFDTASHYEPTPGLGQLFWQRDYKKLIDLAEEKVLDHPEESQIWYLLGFAYAVEGQYENAIRALKIAGLPDKGEGESQVANDQVAILTLAAALQVTGAPGEARVDAEFVAKVAKRFADTGADQTPWANTVRSCALAILGRDDEAMTAFSHVNDRLGLPRLPWLKDLLCFKRFADDPRYLSVIGAVEKRQADLRLRVAAQHQ